ncbi:MAG: GGDEF domain-containing protein, partial [Desulfuromusa sp.]|nr:GGDEF domain-containing protein [Desulfuromusa sp.]
GGEEFAILLEDSGLSGALDVSERLRKKVESLSLFFQGEAVPVTISLGVTEFPRDTDNQDALFNYADQALYRAKEQGRNRSVCWRDMS